MDSTRVELDSARRRLVFHGDCLEMHPSCHAMCCRHTWNVTITQEERDSGRYDSEPICCLTFKACTDAGRPCINLEYRLAKKGDGSCVYLQGDLCSIYAERPETCRKVECGGWNLTSIFPPESAGSFQAPPPPSREAFIDLLRGDMTFVLHPLLKVHTVFYRRSLKEIIFVKEMVGACGRFNTRDHFHYPQLDDEDVMALIDLFNRKETLDQIYNKYHELDHPPLSLQQFYEIVWLLNRHNIALDSRNFEQMLGGVGKLAR